MKIICASNKNLSSLVESGVFFREDLFYRLNVLKLKLPPPLRERPRDIIDLSKYFIKMNCKKLGYNSITLSEEAEELLQSYSWLGNVRELSNFCERLCVLLEEGVAEATDVLDCLEESERLEELLPSQNDLVSATMTSEKEILLQVLENSKTKREAALKLGIDPSTLWRKMKKHGLE